MLKLTRGCTTARCRSFGVHVGPAAHRLNTSKAQRGRGMATSDTAPPAVDRAEYSARWEKHWGEDGVEPNTMWDIGQSAPTLLRTLTEPTLLGSVAGLTCFTPGCGRGYDVITFAKHGAAQSVGLELAQSAVAAAEQEVQARVADGSLTRPEAIQLVAGDFFQWESSTGGFDVGYDYTFGCAMHPSMRHDWAKHWARHVKPGGRLVTLIFPVDDRDPTDGPPFPVSPALYKSLLEPAGFRLDHLEPVAPEHSVPKRVGREFLGLWTRAV